MQGSLSIERMCHLVQVSRSGFYRYLRERWQDERVDIGRTYLECCIARLEEPRPPDVHSVRKSRAILRVEDLTPGDAGAVFASKVVFPNRAS